MTTKTTVDIFLTAIRKSGLIAPDRLTRLLEDFRQRERRQDAHTLANELVAAQALTRWQADKLLEGKHSGFFLGKYRLLSLLGKGGMSSVYLAEHVLMRRRCAIKVLPTRRVNDSSYLGRFHREAQAVAALDHSNIVRAYDVDHETQRNKQIHFLVMEYVEGQSLLDLVQKSGPVDFVSAADYVRQSAEGLAHAHAAGMVHRDVKPGNLLVESSGTVKILDLGLARFFRDKEDKSLTVAHDEKVLGTADYLAPEQARDSHGVDARADIYSLGCTFYFLLTGHPPFSEGTLAQRLLAHQVLDPPPITNDRPDTPPEIVQIVERMMSKDPDERYQDAQDVADVLVDWLSEHGGEDWRRRNPGLSGSGSGGSDVRRAAEAAATAISQPAADETSTAGMAVHVETADAPDSSLEGDAARTQPAVAAIARPQFSAADAPSGDDSALAMFLTKLTDTPPPAPAPAAARESSEPPQADGPDRAAPAGRAPSKEARARPAEKPVKTAPPPDRVPAQPAVPVAHAVRRPAAPSSNGDRRAVSGAESQETLLEMPPLEEPVSAAETRPAVGESRVAAAAATAAPARSVPAQPAAARREPRPSWLSPLRSRPAVLIAAALALVVVFGAILAMTTGSSEGESGSDDNSGKGGARAAPAAPVNDPLKLIGKPIDVGPVGAFKTINEAVDYVREHFRPSSRVPRQVIRVAGGTTYAERLDLTGKSAGVRTFPAGVSIICTGDAKAVLEPVGPEPVVKLDGVQRFLLEGFEIRGQQPTAVELSGYLEGTQLKNLEIAGFGQVGVLGHEAKGALTVGRQWKNELLLEDIVFRASGPNPVGVRFEGETGRVEISGCRFLQPMASGVEFAGDTRYTQVRHSIFERVDVGVRFGGSTILKSVALVHNTFYGVNRGIVFSEMPQSSSADLAFHHNLFDQVASAEMLVEAGFDQSAFNRLLAGGGPEENWTTRNVPLADGAIDLFTSGGRQGATVAHASTDSGHPQFLAPAADSPHAQVPADPGRGLQPWVGAVGP